MKLQYTNDYISCHYVDSSRKHIMDNFMNAVYSKAKNAWRIPNNLWAMRELATKFPELTSDPDFVRRGKELRLEIVKLLQAKNMPESMLRDTFLPDLRPYQKHDVYYLRDLPCAGVFNEPRTGKTPTVISLIKELGLKRNIIITPASLVWNWVKEFEKWHPEETVYVASGTPKQRSKLYTSLMEKSHSWTLIISKDTLKTDSRSTIFGQQFDLAIVDEAHFLRNWKSKQSEAVIKVKAGRRYALTGTPTVKHPSDIFGILRFLYPSKFPSFWQFADRYFGTQTNYMGRLEVCSRVKPHREKELQEMVGILSVQRKRKEVMQWLPEKQYSTFTVSMDSKQRKLYDEMAKFFLASDGNVEIDTQNVITQMMRMRQLCLDPRLLGFEVAGAKTEAILEYLENHREPIVIMSMFTSYLKMLSPMIESLGLKVGFIHGEMSNQEKQDSATCFQTRKYDILLCNIISAGTGFTLDAASSIIFTDKAWNPAENEQAEDRVCPTTIEKNHKHEIISFEVMNTVDQRINALLSQKKSLTDIINEGGREAIRRLLM